ncbi:MAG: hypothetical protein IJ812_04940, partial [Schwartzia sp.]|nr:hypothetical protein [Schwartzia sp. (in: firmicutes)]
MTRARDHDGFESGAHAQKFPFQFAANVFQKNHLDQSKVNFILVEFFARVNDFRGTGENHGKNSKLLSGFFGSRIYTGEQAKRQSRRE